MCTNNENVQFDFSEDFGDSNYKSCFARSVAVNSQFHTKSLDVRQLQASTNKDDFGILGSKKEQTFISEISRVKKEETHRLSCCNPTNGGVSTPAARRNSDLPVENLALQSQVDALQWQLKHAQNSRDMYRAVMAQVVRFLERAHHSLDLLCEKGPTRGVSRARSEFHVADERAGTSMYGDGYTTFRDLTWRRPKRQQMSPDEIPPDKLSQEAFRLLRTAQSLLNTREPELAHAPIEQAAGKDQEFLSQLAKEFPRQPQRAMSFSFNPQLISPSDREIRISTAFNRKLSLQRSPSLRQESHTRKTLVNESIDGDYCLMSTDSKRGSFSSISCKKNCLDSVLSNEKTTTGSVSSAEDESGFSSMNSFQEVGLPLQNSTILNNDSENLCDISVNSSDSNITQINISSDSVKSLEKSKLIWNRPDRVLPIAHRRWSSTPVEVSRNDPLKVLWV